jgi:hypothetical protein
VVNALLATTANNNEMGTMKKNKVAKQNPSEAIIEQNWP